MVTFSRSSSFKFGVLCLVFSSVVCLHASQANAKDPDGCTFSDLNAEVDVPEGYHRLVTDCPKVAYSKAFSSDHALGFFVAEVPFPFLLTDDELDEFVRGQTIVTQSLFDQESGADLIYNNMIDDKTYYENELVQSGGACRGMEAKFYVEGRKHRAIERRKGLICVFKGSGGGPRDWIITNVFAFEMNMDPEHVRFSDAFDGLALDLFRSLRTRNAATRQLADPPVSRSAR